MMKKFEEWWADQTLTAFKHEYAMVWQAALAWVQELHTKELRTGRSLVTVLARIRDAITEELKDV